MYYAGVSLKYVLSDEKLVATAYRRRRHCVLILAPLRLEETHLLVVRRSEDLLLLGISGELPREYLLLNVSVWADF
jgi:hypothetical protein